MGCVCVCVLMSKGHHIFLSLIFFSSGKVSAKVFFGFLPLVNYKFKFNQPSCESGLQLTQLLEMAKACGSNPAGTSFLLTRVFVLFLTIVCLFLFVAFVSVDRLFLKAQLSSKC